MSEAIKAQFLLDPDVVYLNHGSFGACPAPVFAYYQSMQRELERNPMRFIAERLPELLTGARGALATYLGAQTDDVVYFVNPTSAARTAVRYLDLQPGDEILTTPYEYPAMESMWATVAFQTGARYIHQATPLPLNDHREFVEALWSGVTERPKIIFLSHIAAFPALIFPVAEICRRARERGIITFVDGAHAPGQLPLNLHALDVDIYVAACHKWMCSPKGAGFLYAHPRIHDTLVAPLVQNRDPQAARDAQGHSFFGSLFQQQGTRDPAAFLAVPEAIRFQAENDWETQRRRCHSLASYTRQSVNALTGLEPLCPDSTDYFVQLVAFWLPEERVDSIAAILRERRIVAVILRVDGRPAMRISYQAYNSHEDADALIQAIRAGLS